MDLMRGTRPARPLFRVTPLVTALVAALVAGAWPNDARADEVAACVKASEQAQSLKDDGKLKRAREQLLICTRDACPAVVKKDCVQWLAEVDANTPSVVVSAKDSRGQDLTAVRVSLDGAPFADKLDGKPLQLDPGEHILRFEQVGVAPVDDKVVVRTGEKNRVISIQFPNTDATPVSPPPPPPASSPPSKPPIAAYVLGGVGVVALGSFTIFGIIGKNAVSDMRNGSDACAPNCDPSRVDAARTKLILADVSLAIGLVAIGVATYMIVTHKGPEETVAAAKSASFLPKFDIHALPGGGVAELGARF